MPLDQQQHYEAAVRRARRQQRVRELNRLIEAAAYAATIAWVLMPSYRREQITDAAREFVGQVRRDASVWQAVQEIRRLPEE